jgi:hypothetical protein
MHHHSLSFFTNPPMSAVKSRNIAEPVQVLRVNRLSRVARDPQRNLRVVDVGRFHRLVFEVE